MADSRSDIVGDVKKLGLFTIVFFFLSFIAVLALTVGRGLSDADFTKSFTLYLIIGGVGLGAIIAFVVYNWLRLKWVFIVPLHEPEDSLVGGLRIFRNPVLLLLFFLMLFFPLFFWAGSSQTFFSAIPHFQAVSKAGGVISDSLLPSINETLVFFIPLVVLLSLCYFFFVRRLHVKGWFYFFGLIIIPLLLGWLWVGFHNLVYSGNEVAQLSTFIFGFLWIFFTVLTMSIIPAITLHFLTNFVLSIRSRGVLSSDQFLLWLVFIELFLIILFFIVYKFDKRRHH